jgi:hypothetical protein
MFILSGMNNFQSRTGKQILFRKLNIVLKSCWYDVVLGILGSRSVAFESVPWHKYLCVCLVIPLSHRTLRFSRLFDGVYVKV